MSRRLVAVSLKSYFGAQRTLEWCRALVEIAPRHPDIELVVLPAAPLLETALRVLDGHAAVGAQDVSPFDDGAVTGGVSAALLAELGVRVAELGHAERRTLFGETDETVAAKLSRAVGHGLVPLLCVGEDERRAPDAAAALVVAELHRVLDLAGEPAIGECIVAYEPRWAIGAQEPAPAEHVVPVALALRAALGDRGVSATRVLYGGSAGPGTLAGLLPAVDGLFLGRFGHDPERLEQVLVEGEQ